MSDTHLESSETIHAWAAETFGDPADIYVVWKKVQEEIAELTSAIDTARWHRDLLNATDNDQVVLPHGASAEDTKKIAEESIDVICLLYRLVRVMGGNPEQLLDLKMAFNRASTWDIIEPGIGKRIAGPEGVTL